MEGTNEANRIKERWQALENIYQKDGTIKKHYDPMKSEELSFSDIIDKLKNIYSDESSWTKILKLKRGEVYKIVAVDEIVDVDSLLKEKKENGLKNKMRCWVPYKKGDPAGHKWLDNQKLFILWEEQAVSTMKSWSKGRWQNPQLYFTKGITWTNVANHASVKARLQATCIPDQKSLRLTPVYDSISNEAFLSILNSDVFSFCCRKFINNTSSYNTNDLRMMPIVIPDKENHSELETLAKKPSSQRT